MKKKEERLPFLLSTFLVFYFQLIVWLKRLRAATTWRKRRHQRCEGERSCCGALIVAPHEPIHKVQLHTRWRSMSSKHPTPKEEGGRCLCRCYYSLFRLLCSLILLILLRSGRLIESRGTVRTITAVFRTMRRHSLPLAPITHLNFLLCLRHGLLCGTFFHLLFTFNFKN
jgi:hypothetical protein